MTSTYDVIYNSAQHHMLVYDIIRPRMTSFPMTRVHSPHRKKTFQTHVLCLTSLPDGFGQVGCAGEPANEISCIFHATYQNVDLNMPTMTKLLTAVCTRVYWLVTT